MAQGGGGTGQGDEVQCEERAGPNRNTRDKRNKTKPWKHCLRGSTGDASDVYVAQSSIFWGSGTNVIHSGIAYKIEFIKLSLHEVIVVSLAPSRTWLFRRTF